MKALFRQTRKHLDAVTGERLEPYQVLEMMCRRELQCSERAEGGDAASAKPPAQVSYTTCRDCQRTTQDGSGIEVDVDDATVARVMCGAAIIGDVDRRSGERAGARARSPPLHGARVPERTICRNPSCGVSVAWWRP